MMQEPCDDRQQHDYRAYAERLRCAETFAGTDSSKHDNDESIAIYGVRGVPLEFCVSLPAAHRFGLVHRTADVLLVRRDGRVLVQKRSSSEATFANRYGCSSGGHLAKNESPEKAALRETLEEVGLDLGDATRLIPLHELPHGIPLYYLEYSYASPGGTLTFCRSDVDAPFAASAPASYPTELVSDWSRAIEQSLPWDPPESLPGEVSLKSVFFNQELTFYYAAVLGAHELAHLHPQSREVGRLEWVTLQQFVTLAQDPARSTDALECVLRHGLHYRLQEALARGIR